MQVALVQLDIAWEDKKANHAKVRALHGELARTPPRAQHPHRFAQQVLGQVQQGRPDLAMDGMDTLVRRAPHRNDLDIQAAFFERGDLLGDEGFGQSWIAFENHAYASATTAGSRVHLILRRSMVRADLPPPSQGAI